MTDPKDNNESYMSNHHGEHGGHEGSAYAGGDSTTVVKPRRMASPRAKVDEELTRNYPNANIEQLDRHNKPVVPGVADAPAVSAVRKGYKPTIEGGPRIKEVNRTK